MPIRTQSSEKTLKPCRNRNLETKRRAALVRVKADAALRRDAHARRTADRTAASLLTRDLPRDVRPHAERLVTALDRSRLLAAAHRPYVLGLRNAAYWHRLWLREPSDWRPPGHNPRRQFADLLRHLLARYPVPDWLDDAFLHGPPPRHAVDRFGRDPFAETGPATLHGREQGWFVHVARGGNLRTAPGLPVPLTKRQAHHAMLAPPTVCGTIAPAIRWGQATAAGQHARGTTEAHGATQACGGTMPTAVRRQLCASFLGRGFYAGQEAFWDDVIVWLARVTADAGLFDAAQVMPLLDYLRVQKFESPGRGWRDGAFVPLPPAQPALSMKGRTLPALLRQTREWHARLGDGRYRLPSRDAVWPSSGIPGSDVVEGAAPRQTRIVFVELCSGGELIEEGRRMRHCVATYAAGCAQGHTAIFAQRVREPGGAFERRGTVEVDVPRREVCQFRGVCNVIPNATEYRRLRTWASAARLSLSTSVQTR